MSTLPVAEKLVAVLEKHQAKVVFAESCTGGLVSAELARVPGVSSWLCGSAVTYRSETKIAWLEVSAEDIERLTAVSDEVARQMAIGAIRKTPEASFSASVTGHFGPEAPEGFDGVVFIGLAQRTENEIITSVSRHLLHTQRREERQSETAGLVIGKLLEYVSEK